MYSSLSAAWLAYYVIVVSVVIGCHGRSGLQILPGAHPDCGSNTCVFKLHTTQGKTKTVNIGMVVVDTV